MKLQHKITLVLLAGLLLVYIGSGWFQRHQSLQTIERFSKSRQAGEADPPVGMGGPVATRHLRAARRRHERR
ncbi:MAG: hypothetical protein U1F98_12925 [Verrucomicrobiota bacterium]